MAIKSHKPTSPGIRHWKSLVRDEITKQKPEKSLVTRLTGPVGRANGSISSRRRQVGAKKYYRLIDFKRNKLGIAAKVKAIEYDPNRGPNIALVAYIDGEKRYILAPQGLKVGDIVMSGPSAEPKVGNALPLSKIPLGSEIHNIEINPGKGGQMVRGAGLAAQLMAREGRYANVKLPSGEVKKVLVECYATIGVLGNSDLRNVNYGKAGRKRHMGRRPAVRGVAMANPSDHPHAGSYKDNGTGHPKTPWGKPARGAKTRRRKHTNKFILVPRSKAKKNRR